VLSELSLSNVLLWLKILHGSPTKEKNNHYYAFILKGQITRVPLIQKQHQLE